MRLVAFLAVLVVAGAMVPVWLLRDVPGQQRTPVETTGDPERGAYLARLAGCVACHTDETGGGTFLGGGPAIVTDYGTFHAPNITSDVNFGIGAWTLEQFAAALVDGRAPDGRRYYPAFPYAVYSSFTDQDIADLWAALQTTTPAQTKAPPHSVGFPVAGGALVGVWNRLADFSRSVVRDPSRSQAWNRGAYIATGPGLCSQCHSPRNLLGAVATGSPLTGARDGARPAGGALTPEALERRGWTGPALATALRTGQTPDGRPFARPMLDFVRKATAHYSDSDMDALVEYLLSPR